MFVLMDEIGSGHRDLNAHEAAWLAKVAAFDRSDEWRAAGFLSSTAALRNVCRMTHGVARAHIELARKLETLPEVAAAFGRGELSRSHAAVIASACTPERAAEMGAVEGELVEIARHHTAKELGGVVRYLSDAIDGDGGAAADDAQYGRRRYHGSRTLDGMLCVDALYDREAADIHDTAIDAELARDLRPGDTRTLSQRKADAVTNLFRQSLDRGEIGTTRAVRPHVTYVVHADEQPAATSDLIDLARAERRRAGRLSAATLERIMCDCAVTRIVMTGESEILDVGRATRTATAAQWKALVVRDGHCQAPGCDQPPDRCQAHHIKHWAPPHNGPTDLDNLQLLCWHHHREKHVEEAKARARGG